MAVQVIQHKTENQDYKAKPAHMAYICIFFYGHFTKSMNKP